jgi:hypothetical protein
VTEYQLGAEQTKPLQSQAERPGRPFRTAGQLVPDEAFPSHAVGENGATLCGYGGHLVVLDVSWRESPMVRNKCRVCARLVG